MPHARLTKSAIARLQPAAKEYYVWDSTFPTFGVRIQPSGHKSYVITYRTLPGRAGIKKRYTLGPVYGMSLEDARAVAQQWLPRIRLQGLDPMAQRQALKAAPTVHALAERYLAEHAEVRKKPGSVCMDRTNLRLHVLPRLGKRLVESLTSADMAQFQYTMRATPGACNKVLALLSKMCNLAEVWGWRTPGSNPVRGIERYRGKKMERFLSMAELTRLGEVLRRAEAMRAEATSVIACIRLLVYTGARLGEIQGLRWTQIDWQQGIARLPDSKTGAKNLFLPPPALHVLERLPRCPDNPYCLPGTKAGQPLAAPRRPWYRVRAEVGLPDVRLHDLRHTWISTGLRAGLPLDLLGRAVGHKHPSTTAGYAHLASDPLWQVAAQVGAELQRALECSMPEQQEKVIYSRSRAIGA
jgi:integrase